MKALPLAAVLALAPLCASAAVKSKPVEYQAGGAKLQGFVAWDDAVKGKRPGVLVVHEWWGHNEHARNQAKRFAKAGYVAFALDMYGKGKVAKHPADAKAFMEEATKDAATMRARFDAALAQLKKQPQVDPDAIAVAGYCFGGTVALQMAREGEPLAAVVGFHAGLAPAGEAAKPGAVKARILVNEGADDPMIPPAQIQAFEKEMTDAGAKFEVITYPGAKHGFTNPAADKLGAEMGGALAYDKAADEKSFANTTKFLASVFGKPAR